MSPCCGDQTESQPKLCSSHSISFSHKHLPLCTLKKIIKKKANKKPSKVQFKSYLAICKKSPRAQAEQLGRSWLQAPVFNINLISEFLCASVLQKSRKKRSLRNWLEFGSAQLSELICLPARALGKTLSSICYMAWALLATVGSTDVPTKIKTVFKIFFLRNQELFSLPERLLVTLSFPGGALLFSSSSKASGYPFK